MDDSMLDLSPRAALEELDRVGQAVRVRSRWYGRYLLTLGAGTIAWYAAVNLAFPAAAGPTGFVATFLTLTLCWTGFVLVLAGWSGRQPVVWRGHRRLRVTLMTAYWALVVVTVLLSITILRDLPGRWALGVVPALPLLVGAWVVRRK